MSIQFYNKGNPEQISGGYLYNKYLLAHLRELGVNVEYLSEPKRSSDTQFIVVDSLMIYELADFLLQTSLPIILLIHLPPDVFLNLEDKETANQKILAQIYAKSHIVVTGKRSQQYLNHYELNVNQLSLIEPGMKQNWRQKTTYPDTPKHLVCIANIVKGKGHLKLLEVLAKLSDLDWQLDLYGSADMDESYFQTVKRRIIDLKLEERVNYRGCVAHDAINNVLLQADLMLQFSDFETYSMVIAEAINTKLPVISTRCGAFEQFEQSGFVHFLKTDKIDEITDEIRPILSDRIHYQKLLEGKILEIKTWKDVGRQFYQLLDMLVF